MKTQLKPAMQIALTACLLWTLSAVAQCKWPQDVPNTSCGGQPETRGYPDCYTISYSPNKESICGDDSSGSTECSVQTVQVVKTTKQKTAKILNGHQVCTTPETITSVATSDTCSSAVLGGVQCPTGG